MIALPIGLCIPTFKSVLCIYRQLVWHLPLDAQGRLWLLPSRYLQAPTCLSGDMNQNSAILRDIDYLRYKLHIMPQHVRWIRGGATIHHFAVAISSFKTIILCRHTDCGLLREPTLRVNLLPEKFSGLFSLTLSFGATETKCKPF